MGNLQALINYHSPLSYIQDLNDQIQDQGMINHPGLGSIQLWKIKEYNQPMMFSYHVHLYKNDSNLNNFHRDRCQIKHPNILAYFACTSSKGQNIGSVQSQQLFFAYYPNTLKQKLIQQKTLPEIEIWNLVDQIVNALAYLQGLNRYCYNNNKTQVATLMFYTFDLVELKIIFFLLIYIIQSFQFKQNPIQSKNQNSQVMIQYHGNLITDSILLSENNQIMVLDQLEQTPNYQQIKTDVYDLGIIMIEILTGRANQLNFLESLKQLAGRYSIQLLQLVGKMIQKDDGLRPDFIQLQEIIKYRFKEPIILHNPYTKQSLPEFITINNLHQKLKNQNQKQSVIIRPQGITKSSNNTQIAYENQQQYNSQNVNKVILQNPEQGTVQDYNRQQQIISIVEYINNPVLQKSQVDQLSNADILTLYQSGVMQNSIYWLQNSGLKLQNSMIQFPFPQRY